MARIDALWAGKDVMTIGDAVATDGRRTYGLALILTALPGFVPGLSSAVGPLIGAAFVALGAQMMADLIAQRLNETLAQLVRGSRETLRETVAAQTPPELRENAR